MSTLFVSHRLVVLTLVIFLFGSQELFLSSPSAVAKPLTKAPGHLTLLLPGEQIVVGTVQHVKSGVIQVNIGHLEPVFLSLQAAAEKGLTSIQPGDKLKIVINDQDQFIDFHKANHEG